jgi:hypothetical protein
LRGGEKPPVTIFTDLRFSSVSPPPSFTEGTIWNGQLPRSGVRHGKKRARVVTSEFE